MTKKKTKRKKLPGTIKVKPTVGRNERISLPEFGLFGVDAKIDTGAYGCSMHCNLIEVATINGEKMLRIIPLRVKDHAYEGKPFLFPYTKKKKVKNSMGGEEERYIIRTKVKIFDREIDTIFSLTDRSKMKFPVLLGRQFLKGRFVVDVSYTNRSIRAELKKKAAETAESKKTPQQPKK
jgi:hypothetical protein